jgi:hypothetical protein
MTAATPSPTKLLAHNLDALLALVALPLFALASWPLAGWFWAVALWAVNRFLQVAVERRARDLPGLQAVGVMGASMLLRPWVGMLVLFFVTKDEPSVAISSVLLFLLLLSVDIATRIVTHRNLRRAGDAT